MMYLNRLKICLTPSSSAKKFPNSSLKAFELNSVFHLTILSVESPSRAQINHFKFMRLVLSSWSVPLL